MRILNQFSILLILSLSLIACNPMELTALKEIPGVTDYVLSGDMRLTQEQYNFAKYGSVQAQDEPSFGAQSAKYQGIRQWPNGVVAVKFGSNISSAKKTQFMDNCDDWATTALLTCKYRGTEARYLYVVDEGADSGCWSFVGAPSIYGGYTKLNLSNADNCWTDSVILHEIGHALGLMHEHQRPDRDTYISVYTNNVEVGKVHNFEKFNFMSTHTGYDFFSIMHYGRRDFSKNGRLTIDFKAPYRYLRGTHDRATPVLTNSDRATVEIMYGARSSGSNDAPPAPPPPGGGFIL